MLSAAAPTTGEASKRDEVVGAQELLGDVHAVEGRVGGEVRRRAVVLGEMDEASVLHAVRFGRHDRPEHSFGDIDVGVEVHAVAAGRDRSVMARDRVRVLTRVELRDQDLQSRLELFDGEHQRQLVQDVGGALTVLSHGLQARVEDIAMEDAVARGADHRIGLARVEA